MLTFLCDAVGGRVERFRGDGAESGSGFVVSAALEFVAFWLEGFGVGVSSAEAIGVRCLIGVIGRLLGD